MCHLRLLYLRRTVVPHQNVAVTVHFAAEDKVSVAAERAQPLAGVHVSESQSKVV